MTDLQRIEGLYDEHARMLHAFLLNLTRSEADTKDILQDLFIKLARQPALLKGLRDEKAFLLRLAHNQAIDLIRRNASKGRVVEELTEASLGLFQDAADPDANAFRKELSLALGELPPDQRAVVHLKLWAGLTFEEIATALELSPNTAASRYRYGIDKLRARLRPLYDEIK
jgi:RNA polymerase sigma-70 factor (ECF subfamily)